MQELGARLAESPEQDVSFPHVSRFGLTEQVIDQWSQTVAAQTALPDLMRRLILSLVPLAQLRHVFFRAYSAANQPGFDGEVDTTEPVSLLADTALSVWELSTEKNIGRKARLDFRKRSDDPLECNRLNITYVALTSRVWPERDKQDFLKEAQAQHRWASVRAYDATDIAQWLSLASPVRAWLAAAIGQDEAGVETAEMHFAKWAARTSPPLNGHIALAGRQAECQQLEQWLGDEPRPLLAQADTVEECVIFLCATMLAFAEPRRSQWLARTLIVTSADAWQRLLNDLANRNQQPLLIVPSFGAFDGSRFGTDGHHVLVPKDRSAVLRGEKPAIDLRPINREALAKALDTVLHDTAKARKLAYECGGALPKLQRSLGYAPAPPPWATQENANLLGAMLLAGAWNPGNPLDQDLVSRLAGVTDFEPIENLTTKLLHVPDPPLRMQGAIVKWRSATDAWEWLFSRLARKQVSRFAEATTEILSKRSPRFDLPPDERIYALMRHEELPESEEIRTGLAEGLARLATFPSRHRDLGLLRQPEIEAMGSRAVGEILKDHDWRLWATLGPNLQPLAEAAPDAFLDALEATINDDAGNLELLFRQDTRGPLLSGFPHAGLLWSLEVLVWESQRFDRVANLLVALVPFVHERNNGNRPDKTLAELFHPYARRTWASNEQRIRALERLAGDAKSEPITWELLLHNLDFFMRGGSIDENTKPRFLGSAGRSDLDVPDFANYTPGEIREMFETTKHLVLKGIDRQPDRLPVLFEKRVVDPMADESLLWVEQHIEQLQKWPAKEKSDLIGHLHNWIAEVRRWRSDRVPVEQLNRATGLAEQLATEDPISRVAWLFASNAGISATDNHEPYQTREAAREQLRIEALGTLLRNQTNIETIIALAQAAPEPWLVGQTLARLPTACEWEQPILDGALGMEDARGPCARAFLACREVTQGETWIPNLAARLIDSDQSNKVVWLLLAVPSAPAIRNWLKGTGCLFAAAYWSQVNMEGCAFRDADDFSATIRSLLDASRLDQALKATLQAIVSGGTLCRTQDLLDLLRFPFDDHQGFRASDDLTQVMSWTVLEIFKVLDRRTDASISDIASLEVPYLVLLDQTDRPPKRVFEILATNPDDFASLVNDLFHPASHTNEEETATDAEASKRRQNRLHCVFRVLNGWAGYPGADLPAAKRDADLRAWCDRVLELTEQADRKVIGQHKVGEVLGRVPAPESDGVWPCMVARGYLREGRKEICAGLNSWRFNSRGAMLCSPGDHQRERDLARKFEDDANRIRAEWPETADFLDSMAREFLNWAETLDQADAKYTDP